MNFGTFTLMRRFLPLPLEPSPRPAIPRARLVQQLRVDCRVRPDDVGPCIVGCDEDEWCPGRRTVLPQKSSERLRFWQRVCEENIFDVPSGHLWDMYNGLRLDETPPNRGGDPKSRAYYCCRNSLISAERETAIAVF